MDDAASANQQRPNYLAEILSLCTTFTSEAIDAAGGRAKVNGFNVDRGEITFTEVAINLTQARETLVDAIQKQKLIQLPITVQKELLANLQSIEKALQGLMSNSDQIENLGVAVEVLNTSIWKYGLHNLSDQVLGYQTKLNQLKQQDVRAKNLLSTLEDGRATSERLSELAKVAEAAVEQIGKARLLVEQDASVAAVSRQQVQDEVAKATASTAAAALSESQAAQHSASAKASSAEIAPLEASIRSFFGEIDQHRRQMASAVDEASKSLTESNAAVAKSVSESAAKITAEIDKLNAAAKGASDMQALALSTGLEANRTAFAELVAGFTKADAERAKESSAASAAQLEKHKQENSVFLSTSEKTMAELVDSLQLRSDETIGKNQERTGKIVDELAVLKESVKEQVAQATGLGQFGAFQSRQNKISVGKYFWVAAVALLALCVVCLTYWIAVNAGQSNLHSAAFWIKLSMNIPLGFLITFCTIQYNRERRLEEEYAFKASISISLTPYRDLIYSILEKEGALKDGSYTSFVVDSVRNVFASPTERIFDSAKSVKGIPEKLLKEMAELVGTIVKASK